MPLRNFILIAAAVLISFACYNVAAKNRFANLFAEALDLTEKEALYPQPREDLFVSAMEGMLKKLDDHSVFIYGNRFNDMENDIRQEFGGVGLYLEVDDQSKKAFVLAPVPGTPAFEAGIQIGDIIVQIDDKPVAGKTREQMTRLLRGPIGERVNVTVERNGERFDKELVRAAINTPSVYGDFQTDVGVWKYHLRDYPQIGYIRLSIFGEKSSEELKLALAELPPDCRGIILDLRNNSGGLLDSAIEICDFFLPPGQVIVGIRRRRGEMVQTYSQTEPEVKPDLPLVVLVNRYSASASEVVAGCLQDHGRALIVGEQSYGKATVQNIIPMQRGLSALKLTTASYWRPSGAPIDRKNEAFRDSKLWGIQPDPGFKVEIDDQDILNVIRDRSIRDLEGLIGKENGELLETVKRLRRQLFDSMKKELEEQLQLESGQDSSNDSPAPTANLADDAAEDEGLYQDATLQRAIEHLNSLPSRQPTTAN